jgi:hypothetical protein
MRLLDGESADAISPSKVEIYSAQLDWRQVQRWNIDQKRIPAGTHILFREPGLWEEYEGYVLGAVALMLLQSALIGGLLVQRRHRRRIEGSLRESERRYRVAAQQNQDLSGRLIKAQGTLADASRKSFPSLGDALDGYAEFVNDSLRNQSFYEKHGRYKASSYAECVDAYYHNADHMMRCYLPGMYLSHLLWPQHYNMHRPHRTLGRR